MIKKLSLVFFIILLSLGLVLLFNVISGTGYIQFSDGAKFADIGRNILNGKGYTSNFSFYNSAALNIDELIDISSWVPPAMPLVIAGFFKIFGISDLSVIATSSFFYLLLVLTTYLLGKRLWGNLVGLLAAGAVAFNPNFLEYAISGASETLFAFEIVLAAYLIVSRKKPANIAAFLVLMLMYFTKAQAIIYISGLVLFFLLLNFSLKRALGYFSAIFILGSALFLMVSKQGLFAITQHLPGVASSDALRGAVQEVAFLSILKKIFYNLYNSYRLLPQVMSPYLWMLFIIGLFKWGKDRMENSFKVSVIFMTALTFLVTALTIPLFRYLHPVVPLVYIFATATLVWIIGQIFKNKKVVAIVTALLIVVFVVGQTLGVIFLDSRFIAKTVNKGKPPVYVVLSRVLKENTKPDSLVVTNLDTWGSWYGERRTVWYPIRPEQLNTVKDLPFDAIYLTSYLIDDENYYMGSEWRQIFENPKSPEDEFIAKNYKFAGEFKISAEETYERQDARAILLVRR